MGDPVATCFRIAESRVLRCCDIPCLVDAATLCAVAPAAMLVITKSVDTPGARVLVGIELRRAGCRGRVTKPALSIASWVLISTLATFSKAPYNAGRPNFPVSV